MKAINTIKTIRPTLFHTKSLVIGILLCWLLPINVWATEQIDGIYYWLNESDKTAMVAYQGFRPNSPQIIPISYSGAIDIPSDILYNGCSYSVTSIGPDAFRDCTGLTSVNIPNSVTYISSYAFYRCTGLSSIQIPNGVTWIGSCAFLECTGLTSVTIPNSVTSIDSDAFSFCTSLTSVFIPNSVTSLGESIFYNCPISTIIVDGGNTVYDSRNNCNAVIETSTNTLLMGFKKTVIPNSVMSIGSWSFAGCIGLTSVDIPNSVTSIGEYAFQGCTGLTSVDIPNSVTSIGEYVFDDCTGLTSIKEMSVIPPTINRFVFYNVKNNCTLFVPAGSKTAYENAVGWSEFENIVELDVHAIGMCGDNLNYTIYSDKTMVISGTGMMYDYSYNTHINNDFYQTIEKVIIEEGVTSIGEFAFLDCTGLTSVDIPSSVTSIGLGAFSGCASMTSVTIPIGVTNIGSLAFYGCASLNRLVIPYSVIEIGSEAFSNCSNLEYIDVHPGNDIFDSRDDCNAIILSSDNLLINGCKNTVIPDGITSISDGAFLGCTGLTSVTIPNSVTDIWYEAFSGCTGLTSLFIPNSVTYLGDYSFSGCTGLTSLFIPNSVTYLGDYSFSGCTGLTSLFIPNSVTTIGSSAFSGCTALTSVTIPNGVTYLGGSAFSGCTGLNSVHVEWLTPLAIENAFDEVDKSACKLYIPGGCKSAYQNAQYWNEFTNVIESLATGPCGDNLTYTIYEDMSMVIVGTGPMWDRDISIEGYSNDGWHKYNEEYYQSIRNVIIGDGVTSIGCDAFNGYASLTSVDIPNSVTSISGGAFEGTGWFENQPDGMVYIGKHVYKYKGEMPPGTEIIIKDGTLTIVDGAFSGQIGLTSVTIPSSVTSIGGVAFEDCTSLTSVTIPNSVTSISGGAFEGCSGLTTIILPDDLRKIRGDTFRNCASLTSITIPVHVNEIGTYAFSGCTGLTSIFSKTYNAPHLGFYHYYNGNAYQLSETVFQDVDKTNCILYVRGELISQYEQVNGWKDFLHIVEWDPDFVPEEPDTDISLLSNAIYVEQTEGRIGDAMDISVKLKNNFAVRGFQFTMELPEGTIINSWTLSQDRMPAGTTMNKVLADGTIEGNQIIVGCALNDGMKTFLGIDGVIATVNVTFTEDMEEGSYPIYLTHNSISDASGQTQLVLSDIKTTLVLEDYVTGDSNGDGMVLIGDVISILNYILGSPSDNFNVKAADVNGDGMILIGDVIAVLNIILNQ